MMLRIFITILLVQATNCIAQVQKDTVYFFGNRATSEKEKAEYYRLPLEKIGDRHKVIDYWINGQMKCEGYSLSVDSIIWDGEFKAYYANGNKNATGSYANGHPIGNWKQYYEDTNRIWAVRSYNLVSDTGEIIRSFYKSGKVKRIEYRIAKRDTTVGICYNELGENIPFTPFEKMPEYKGDVNRFLGENIRYPDEARDEGYQGRVNFEFAVDTLGNITDLKAINPHIHPALIKEAARVIKLFSGRWKPGLVDDKPVKVYYTMPILFRLE